MSLCAGKVVFVCGTHYRAPIKSDTRTSTKSSPQSNDAPLLTVGHVVAPIGKRAARFKVQKEARVGGVC